MNNNRNQLEYLQEIQMHSPTLEVEDEGCWVGRSGSRVVTFSWCLRGIQHIQLSLGSSKSRPYTSVVWGRDPRDWEDMEDRREVTPWGVFESLGPLGSVLLGKGEGYAHPRALNPCSPGSLRMCQFPQSPTCNWVGCCRCSSSRTVLGRSRRGGRGAKASSFSHVQLVAKATAGWVDWAWVDVGWCVKDVQHCIQNRSCKEVDI